MNIITFKKFKNQFSTSNAIEKVRESILKDSDTTKEDVEWKINEMLQYEYRKYIRNKHFRLVSEHAKILRESTQSFDFNNPPIDPVLLSDIMKETMTINNGIGLAANQLGFPYSVFVFGNPKKTEDILTIFNPKIVDTWGDDVMYQEGCISFSNLYIEIKRPESIRVRYADVTGDIDTQEFQGIHARVFQHEYDHLQGVVFTSRAKSFHLNRARKNKKILDRRRKKVNG